MPGAWIWILVYLVVFALIQLLLYRYLQSDGGASVEHATPDYGDSEETRYWAAQQSIDTDDGEGIRCPRCGAYNEHEPAYTYCQQCVGRLQ